MKTKTAIRDIIRRLDRLEALVPDPEPPAPVDQQHPHWQRPRLARGRGGQP